MGIETALFAVGVALAAGGTAYQISAQERSAKTAVRVADYNAEVDINESLQANMEQEEIAARIRKNNKKVAATQRSKIAAAGVLTAGSPLELMGLQAAAGELEAMDALRLGRTAIRAGKEKAKARRFGGASTASAFKTKQGGTLLSGASSITSSTLAFKQNGGFEN